MIVPYALYKLDCAESESVEASWVGSNVVASTTPGLMTSMLHADSGTASKARTMSTAGIRADFCAVIGVSPLKTGS
jgi:hypothetical protein